MMVAIPAISNTIKNSRKNAFVSTSGEIVSAVKNLVNADSIKCGDTNLSGAGEGTYILKLSSDADDGNSKWTDLLDGGVKSPFGGSSLYGTVQIYIDANSNYDYKLYLTDKSYCIGTSSAPVDPKKVSRTDVTNSSCGTEFMSAGTGVKECSINAN